MIDLSKYPIDRLPKWAQGLILNLEARRKEFVLALERWTDSQTPGMFYADEYVSTGDTHGPDRKRRYFEGDRIFLEHQGVKLEVVASKDGIQIQWDTPQRHGVPEVGLIPTSFQSATLKRIQVNGDAALLKALKPFEQFGRRLMDGRKGIPKTGGWFRLDSGEPTEAEITIENFREAINVVGEITEGRP